MKPGAFFDRDGTLIVDAHYLSDAARVRVIPGAVEAVQFANHLGAASVIVTNQSGIAQGLLSAAQYEAIRQRVEALFQDAGAPIAASYHCPHHPDVSGVCECRKPATKMYRDAARELSLDLHSSLFVGDRRRDVEPSLSFGGFGILVPSHDTPGADGEWADAHAAVASSLLEAVTRYADWLKRRAA